MGVKTMKPSKENYLTAFSQLDVEMLEKLWIIAVNWKPTVDNINSLPDPLRGYIHDLVANSDPSGIVRENIILRDLIQSIDIDLLLKDGTIKTKKFRYAKTSN